MLKYSQNSFLQLSYFKAMLRKGFLLTKAKGQAEEVDTAICKHCKESFERLTRHLNQNMECKAAYTDDEFTAISAKLKSERK